MDDFYRNEKTVESLTSKNLKLLIDTQKMRGDSNVMYAQIERNRRMTLPFSAFILTIMGVALTSRKRRGGIGWNIALGIGLAFLYILFLRFSEMFVYTGVLPAWIALWLRFDRLRENAPEAQKQVWIWRTARSVLIDLYRRQHICYERLSEQQMAAIQVTGVDYAECIEDMKESLNEGEQRLLQMRLDGYNVKEIGGVYYD